MIQIKELKTSSELREFVELPFLLFEGDPWWVPPLVKDELETLDRESNPVFEAVDARFFMAYKKDRPVGRIAAVINWVEVKEQKKPKLRFGWYDTVDDINVAKLLIEEAEKMGRKYNLEYIEGPVGFSTMDKAGMLVEGFEEPNTMITWYGMPHYHEHLEQLGFQKEKEWVEFEIEIPEEGPSEKVKRFAELIMEKYDLRVVRFSSTGEILDYADEMFDLINKTYSDLSTFVPISKKQVAHLKEKYFSYLHPDFINCVADANGKLVAFAITMPSFAEALQKARGKLFPLGWIHLLKAWHWPDKAAFYLIGVEPKYQNKGLTSIIFKEMNEMLNRKGISKVETNPELEDNTSVQALWNSYNNRLHKRRRTYRRKL